MRLLLDTHAFLWFVTADPRLGSVANSSVQDPANQRLLSAASLWEMADVKPTSSDASTTPTQSSPPPPPPPASPASASPASDLPASSSSEEALDDPDDPSPK